MILSTLGIAVETDLLPCNVCVANQLKQVYILLLRAAWSTHRYHSTLARYNDSDELEYENDEEDDDDDEEEREEEI